MSLKNCPFCGSPMHPEHITRMTERRGVSIELFSAKHDNPQAVCFMADSGLYFSDLAALEQAWNKRSLAAAEIELSNPPYFTPENIAELVAGSSGTFKAAIDQAIEEHLAEDARVWLNGEGTEKPKGLLG